MTALHLPRPGLEPRPHVDSAALDGRGVVVRSGAATTHLDPHWLRDQSTELGQVDPCNSQRLFTPLDIDPDLAVVECLLTGDRLTLAFSDQHRATLSCATIAQRLGWSVDPEAPPPPQPWTGATQPFPAADWAGIGWRSDPGDDASLVAALDDFYRCGYVVFRNVPTRDGAVARVAERMGYLAGQNFGSVFDVRVEPEPADLAYTSIGLLSHTDLPYRQPPPGIQLLHCLANEAPGGESTLTDGLAAWHSIRAREPDLYRALVETEVEYRYDSGTDTVVNTGHVFELDRAGRLSGVRFNPKLDTPLPRSGSDLRNWYQGRRWLAEWFADPLHQVHFRLEAGDLMFLDNHRVLHGRTAFDNTVGRRHLQGCYIEHDGPDTLYRLTRRRLAASA